MCDYVSNIRKARYIECYNVRLTRVLPFEIDAEIPLHEEGATFFSKLYFVVGRKGTSISNCNTQLKPSKQVWRTCKYLDNL